MVDSERLSSDPIMGHIKDVRSAIAVDRDRKDNVQIQGHVWRVRNVGRVVFVDVTDGTGAIQIVCDRRKVGEEDWSFIKTIHKGVHVDIWGSSGVTSKGFVSVFAEHISRRLSARCPGGEKENEGVSEMAEEMLGLFMLSRVRRALEDSLRALAYDEIESPLLRRTSDPLGKSCPMVKFNGVGPAVPITPSPAPILQRAVLDGIHEVFAFSRIYGGDLRIADGSGENFVLCVRKADPSKLEMARVAENLVKAVFGNFRTSPPENSFQNEWIREHNLWQVVRGYPNQMQAPLANPVILLRPDEDGEKGSSHILSESNNIEEVFWIYWPNNLCLAEGHTEVINGIVRIGGVTLYLDVLVKVILGRENIYLHRGEPDAYVSHLAQ